MINKALWLKEDLLETPNDINMNVSLAGTGPCTYTTLYSKALLILSSTSDNTLLNLCLFISIYIDLTLIKLRL